MLGDDYLIRTGDRQAKVKHEPTSHENQTYGRLVPLKMRLEPMIKPETIVPEGVANFIGGLSFQIVGVKDRYLMKLLKSRDQEGETTKGVNFVALKNMLGRQVREQPADPCLVHNKAVLLAYKHQNQQSLKLFKYVSEMPTAASVLENGWQLNWAIVLARVGDFDSLHSLTSQIESQEIEELQIL